MQPLPGDQRKVEEKSRVTSDGPPTYDLGEDSKPREVSPKGLESKPLLLIVATAWGSKEGGINVFNKLMCDALTKHHGLEVEVVCAVPRAQCLPGPMDGTRLFALDADFGDFTEEDIVGMVEVFLRAHRPPAWIVGHDAITGPFAMAITKRIESAKLAIVHHMNYKAYTAFKSWDALDTFERERRQRRLLSSADLVFAVGPKLRDSARDLIREPSSSGPRIVQLIPGIDGPNLLDAPTDFQAIALGRLGASDEIIKQSRIAVEGFARFAAEARLSPDSRLLLYGALSGSETPEERKSLQKEVFDRYQELAGRLIQIHLLPYSESGEHAEQLQRSSVCIVPSLHEGFGLVAWEAIQACVPLVVSTNSGVWQFLYETLGRYAEKIVRTLQVTGSFQEPNESDISELVNHLKDVATDPNGEKLCAKELRDILLRREFTQQQFAATIIDALELTFSRDDPASGKSALEDYNVSANEVSLAVTQTLDISTDSKSHLDIEIDLLRNAIQSGEVLHARHRLESIIVEGGIGNDTLFRCLSTLGLSFYVNEDFIEASKYLFQAYAVAPQKEGAQTNLSLAHLILNQPEKALDVANETLKDFPDSRVAQERKLTALIQLDRSAAIEYYRKVTERTPSFELIASLQLFDDEDKRVSALKVNLERATAKEPSTLLALATSLHDRVRSKVRAAGYKPISGMEEDLAEAYSLCSEAIEIRRRGDRTSPQYLRALLLRASISLKLGHIEDASEDCAAVLQLQPDNTEATRLDIIVKFSSKDYAAVVTACEKLTSLESIIVEPYAVSLAELGQLTRAASLLESKRPEEKDNLGSWFDLLSKIYLEIGDTEALRRVLADFRRESPTRGLDAEIYALKKLGNYREAGETIESAIQIENRPNRKVQLTRELAEVRWLDGDYDASAQAYMKIAVEECFPREVERGLTAFRTTARFKSAMEWLEHLESRPDASWAAQIHRSDIMCDLDDYAGALSVLSSDGPMSMEIRVVMRKVKLLTLFRRTAEAMALLTASKDYHAGNGPALREIAEGMYRLGEFWEAARLLYAVRKLAPKDERTNSLFLQALLRYNIPDEVAEPPVVGPDCVATVSDGSISTDWILETDGPVDPLRNELTLDDPLSTAMLGLRVGERFRHGRGNHSREFIVAGITSKLVVAWREVAQRFNQAFPENEDVKLVDLTPESLEVLKLEKDAKFSADTILVGKYAAGELSFHSLAEQVGQAPYELFHRLLSAREVRKPARSGTAAERELELRCEGLNTLVLDSSATCVLSRLRALSHLSTSYKRIYLTPKTGGLIISSLQSGKLEDRSRSENQELFDFISQFCSVSTSEGLLAIDPNLCASGMSSFGLDAIKIIGVAVGTSSCLVSDDRLLREFCNSIGVAAISSAAVLKHLVAKGQATLSDYSRWKIQLETLNYQSLENW